MCLVKILFLIKKVEGFTSSDSVRFGWISLLPLPNVNMSYY